MPLRMVRRRTVSGQLHQHFPAEIAAWVERCRLTCQCSCWHSLLFCDQTRSPATAISLPPLAQATQTLDSCVMLPLASAAGIIKNSWGTRCKEPPSGCYDACERSCWLM